jgi:hypothetical protein
MRSAENDFHEIHETSIAADRARLEALEQTAQADKASSNAMRGGVGAPMPDRQAVQARQAATAAEIKDLKASLARPVFVAYRDWNADKATLLELLSKSKFRAMSFVDELGVRAHGYTINKFLAARHIHNDLALLSLVGDQSSDSVLIRSSSTGGANILSVRGADSPRFNLMTLTSPQAVNKIASRLKEAAPCRGITLTLATPPRDTLTVQASHITKVISKVYAVDNPTNRITVEFAPQWALFLGCDPSGFRQSEASISAQEKSLCSIKTLVHSVVRAIITRRIFLEEPNLEGADTPERTITLGEDDLAQAVEWASALLEEVIGTKHLSQRAENATKAREARAEGVSPKRLAEAREQLIKMIQADGHFVPRSTALRAGITARTLDAMLETYPRTFTTLADIKRPGNNADIKQAVTLVAGWECEDLPPPPSGPVGGKPDVQPGSEIPDDQLDNLYRKWQAQACANLRLKNKTPSIRVIDLPVVLRGAATAVQRRHWQTTTFLPSGEGASMELWFRFAPDGKDMCAWKESFIEWKLHQRWLDKDEGAFEDREPTNPPTQP